MHVRSPANPHSALSITREPITVAVRKSYGVPATSRVAIGKQRASFSIQREAGARSMSASTERPSKKKIRMHANAIRARVVAEIGRMHGDLETTPRESYTARKPSVKG